MNTKTATKIFLSFLLLSLSYASSFGQLNLTNEAAKHIPNFSPLAPNAAGAQKYGDYSVSLATGIPDITIPLCTAQDGSLSQNISLSYHLGGHTMASFASLVGWGWNLNYGPAMNRTINGGLADDRISNGSYLNNPTTSRDLCNSTTDYSFVNTVNGGSVDTEPDLFSFATGESSGKFMLRKAPLKPFLMPWQPVDIKYITAPNIPVETPGVIEAFEVVNPNGIAYKYGTTRNIAGLLDGNGATEYQSTSVTTPIGITDNGLVSWHIAKIQAPNTTDEIKFQYQPGGTFTQSYQSWGASVAFDQSQSPISNSTQPVASLQVKSVTQHNIHKITYTNGEIEFEQSLPSEPRADQVGSNYLKQIKVYNYENGLKTLLKRIAFTYSYFKDIANADGRLKLDKIEIYGGTTTTEPLTYTFEYTTNNYSWYYPSGTSSPNADWNNVDYFGYFNGKNNSHTIDIASYNGITILPGAADRSSVENLMKEATLAKITYPAGGYTTFETEANRYQNANTEVVGGGLRIKAIRNYASTGQLASMKRYQYSSEAGTGVGKLSSTWSFPASGKVGEIKYLADNGYDVHKTEFLASNGLAEMSSHDATPVYYTSVTEYGEEAEASSTNGSTNYTFSYEPDVIVNTPSSLIRDIEPWKRGLLLSKEVKNSSGTIVSSLTNQYSAFNQESIINTAKVLHLNQTTSTCEFCSSGMGFDFGTSPGIAANVEKTKTLTPFPCNNPEFDYLTGINKTGQMKLTKSINLIDGVTTKDTTIYDNFLMPISTTTYDSYTNHSNTQNTKYPTDASYNSNTDALALRTRNMVAQPLETEESENLNGTVNIISKQKNVYASFTGTNARGLANNILQSSIQIAPNGASLETRVEFTEYDTDGNPLEYKIDGVPTALLWGYGGNSVIATIKNATKDEVNTAKTTAGIDQNNFNITTLDSTRLAEITAFQNALPNAQASWYTHIPHVGISEMIAINGLKTSFEYDALQRLKLSKDHKGNLLAFNQYNFGLNPTITSSVFSVPTSNTADANNTAKANISISYFDGLGRDLQKVGRQQSPTLNDIISNTVEYDTYSRAFKSYLPAPATVGTGERQVDPQTLGSTFYGDSRPFSQVMAYDNSPLNREKETLGPGQDWKNIDPALDKKVKHFYETNAENEVRYYYLDASNNIKKSGFFPDSSLYKKRKLDEESHETINYTDKRGRQIMTQQQDDSGYITTYYLYDGAGRPRAIIQPEGYLLDASIDYNTAEWNRWVFEYQYDTRGRLIEKKVPGAAKEYFVYDKWDRLIMSQDGYQAEKGFWKFNKYDALDRNIYAGIKADGNSRSTHQGNANNTAGRYESKNDTEPYYSLSDTYPAVSDTDIWLANYFNDYTKFRTTDSLKFIAGQTESLLYDNTKGLLTGSYERSSIDNAWLKSANYYDSKNRLIQSRKIHHLSKNANEVNSRADVNSIEYNFAGDVVKQIGSIKKASTDNLPFSNQNNVDLLGRITGNFHTVNTIQQNIATYIYDEINRIKTKNIGLGGTANTQADGNWNEPSVWNGYQIPGLNNAVTIDHNINVPANYKGFSGVLTINNSLNFDAGATLQLAQTTSNTLLQKIDIQHHIRGGLLGVNLDAGQPSVANDGDLFSFKLNYGYDGNITAQSWKDKANNQDRAWDYAYDPSSRIKSATYTPSGTYNVSGITYDKNGNIKTLNRAGIDALTYDYTNSGNLLLKVTDGTTGNTNVGDFRNGTNTGNDYEYYTDGSLKLDRNKTIKTIEYDPFHKKVKYVEFDDGKWNKFEYAGNGFLIKRQNSDGEYWDYTANIVYKNGTAYQMNTAEGRAVYNGTAWEYEFEYRDQIEDLRLAFKNENGLPKIVQQNTNDIWGWEIKGLSSVLTGNNTQNNFRFLKRESVFETGWANLNNRMIDPQLGRFISQDKLNDEGGQESLTLYQYGWNNPVLRPDADGNCPTCPLAVAGGIIGGLVGGGIEIGSQLYNGGKVSNWGAVGGATAQGAITGAVAGFTGGTSLAIAVGASAGANVAGGAINNAVQGKEITVSSVVTDAVVGAAAGVGGKLLDKVLTKAEGIVYQRVNPKTGAEYIGQAKSAKHYEARQAAHDKAKGVKHDYTIIENAKSGKKLNVAEEKHIRAGGGPTNKSNPNGKLENRRHQMSDENYKKAGGQ